MTSRPRVAIFGGNTHGSARPSHPDAPRFFRAPRRRGIGELRRLLSSIHAGAFDTVIVYARWKGHAATRKVRAACRRRAVTFVIVP
jgi:hypothetical protein